MSDFFARKMKTYFRLADLNKSGTLTKEDYEEFGRRFSESHKLGEAQANNVKKEVLEVWSFFTKGNVNVALSEELFVELMKTQAFEPGFAESLVKILDTSFGAVDTNGNGRIELDELTRFFETYGLDKSAAPPSFKAIDADGDGFISKEEFSASGLAFFTSKDEEHPSKLYWGPLAD